MSTQKERATAALDQCVKELKAKNIAEDARKRAARQIRELVNTAKQEMSAEQFQIFFDQVNQRTTALINGSEVHEHMGGVYILDALVDFEGVDATLKSTRFQHHVLKILQGKDPSPMQLAAMVLGKLCRPGGSVASDLVQSQVNSATEWLQGDRVEEKRYAAVLLLRELARNAPTLMYNRIDSVFKHIWGALRDQRYLIRTTAAEAVSACFKIMRERDQEVKQRWMNFMYNEAVHGLRTGTVESVHASLLVLQELLEQGGMYMQEHYQEACEIVFRHKDHREAIIRRTVVLLIPDLANYAPAEFATDHLHKFMVYLSGMLKKDKERNDALLAIGNIANSVKSAIAPYLDSLMQYIREGLSLQARRRGSVDPVFDCISRLAVAVGQTLSKYMEALLDPIFACELTPKLTQALVDMAFYIPPVKSTIQERLLDMLSYVLCGEPFRPLGAPYPKGQTSSSMAMSISSASSALDSTRDGRDSTRDGRDGRDGRDSAAHERSRAEIKLALNTLGSFDFSGHVLNEFVRDVAVKYVEDDDAEIREAAALTCCQLYVRDPIVHQTSHHALQVVSDVVEKLLTVGVADPEAKIRQTVLQALDERFDEHLAKAENIRTLFFALRDESFAIREVAVSIVGRLARRNPAYVVPQLRKTVLQLLTELEYTDVPRRKEESATLLRLLTHHAQDLVKPYVDAIASVLLPRACDQTASVAATVLQAIGELCTIGGELMLTYQDRLMPIIIDALQDQSAPAKREAALRTLGQLASNAGYVIKPYVEYPQLMEILLSIIRGEPQHGGLRQETIKLIGILGALDPYKYQQAEVRAPETQRRPETAQVTDVTLMMNGLTPSQEDYYPTVVINALLNILRDQSLSQWHVSVVDAIMQIFVALGLKCVSFLDRVVPAFLGVIRASASGKLDYYFNQLSKLVGIVRQHIRVYLDGIIEVLQDFWPVAALQSTILSLVESIARSLEGEFKVYLAGLLPLMLGVLEKDVTVGRRPSERILHAFLVFGASGEEYMHLIIPVVVRLFDKPGQPAPLRKTAVETIGALSGMVNLNDYANQLIHPLTRAIASGDAALRVASLDTLCALMQQLGRDYLHFEGTVRKTLAAHNVQHAKYEAAVQRLRRGEALPQDLTARFVDDEAADVRPVAEAGPAKKLAMHEEVLSPKWETKGKSTKDDWHEWFRDFSTTLLSESPNQALRACASLAGSYAPLARELFNSAFVSCWGELSEQRQEGLISSIEHAIRSEQIPPDLLGQLLNLAEFMEHDDKALPIDIRTLGREAGRCHAYAKALHYKELEFLQDQSSSSVEALISINNQLQQVDAAIGILRKAQLYKDGITLREGWFEKLERWDEALNHYDQRERELLAEAEAAEGESGEGGIGGIGGGGGIPVDVVMGKMRCYHALCEWDQLTQLVDNVWTTSPAEVQRRIAPLAVTASWALGKWDLMDGYLQSMKRLSPDRAFFGAILALHRNQFREAVACVEQAREGLDTELSALVSESYSRAYQVIVRVQMLAELEELIAYKQCDDDKQATLRRTWETRLKGCQRNVEVWQRMLRLRSLVLTPHENMHMWTKFANLSRKSGRMGLAEKSLKQLIGTEAPLETVIPYWTSSSSGSGSSTLINHANNGGGSSNNNGSLSSRIPSHVIYAVLKYQWDVGQQPLVKNSDRRVPEKTLYCLRMFTNEIAHRVENARMQLSASQHQAPAMLDGVDNNSNNMMNGMNGNASNLLNDPAGLAAAAADPNSAAAAAAAAALNPQAQRHIVEQTTLLAKCYLRQGEWIMALNRDGWQSAQQRQDILACYSKATQYNPRWYKAWHAWALANFEVVQALSASSSSSSASASASSISAAAAGATATAPVSTAVVLQHVVPAVRGFFESIALSSGSSLQDTLRLLALWLTHGGHAEVNAAVTEGFSLVSVDTWLEVIPQLIARINQNNKRVQQSVHNLIADVGRAHPQALVYPLTVAIKSWQHNSRRSRSAAQIMDSMRQHSAHLVEQADLVSHELIRVAVLWHELWHEGLEEASRCYFGDHNIEGMFAALEPLHEQLERGPETLREVSFAQTFGRDLAEAREWCRQYENTRDVNDLSQAWDLYYTVFRRISRQLPQMTSLELTYCSPRLLNMRDLDLAVPGTYRSSQGHHHHAATTTITTTSDAHHHDGQSLTQAQNQTQTQQPQTQTQKQRESQNNAIVRIAAFDTTVPVISSKQRPRKLTMVGSDGVTYAFLLKGHEDIRQDERVMQLFGLCNTLLANDSESSKRHLGIQCYPAIPLSQNSGLLGWVPNSDTVHTLIRDYRESRKILLNIEHRIMLQMAPDYDNLTLMQKVEVFGYALDNTTGQDLYRVLWLKSRSSESWLVRRTNYTRSLGVMSMVGYILGLGDRHPSNLMLDRVSGKVVHIDFGDCFEVAMKREKYPERVPFRLTRMLTYAMEVSNIEGSFRITCEQVMRVLRENKESVMAVLEAFIHDPLLTWRLTNAASPAGPNFTSEREQAIVGAQAGRARRPSVLDAPVAPSELLAAQAGPSSLGLDGGPPGGMAGGPPGTARPRARTNSSAAAAVAAAAAAAAAMQHQPNGGGGGGPNGAMMTNGNGHVNNLNPNNANANGNIANGGGGPAQQQDQAEMQNARAIEVLERVAQKLTGRDFKPNEELEVVTQVDKLIMEAIKFENLCQHYIGWCSFW